MAWFWVQVAIAALTVVSTVKAKQDFKKQQKKLNKSQGFKINRFGQDEPVHFVLGERRVAPIFVYRSTQDDDAFDDIPNERYSAMMVWSTGRVNDVRDIKLGDKDSADWGLTEIDWVGNIVSGVGAGNIPNSFYYNPPDPIAADAEDNEKVLMGDDNNFLMGIYRGGVDGSPQLWGEFNNMVVDDMTGVQFDGLTFSTLRIFLNEDNRKTYSTGEPEFTALVKGPDVLTPYGLSGVWDYSSNPVDHLYWYLTDTVIGKGIDPSAIDKTSFVDMSRYCNELVTTPDGDKKRFTCNYVIDTSQTHQEIIDDILMGCNAVLIDSPTGIRIDIDRPKSIVMTIDEGDLIEKIQSSINDVNDRFNEVIVRFADAELDFKESEVSFPDRASTLYADWIAEDKNIERIEEIELESVTDYYEALRYAEYIAYKSRNSKTVSISIGAKGWQLEEGDVIGLNSTHRGWVNKPFIVQGVNLKADSVGLDLMEYNAEVYSYVTPDLRVPPAAPSLTNPFLVLTPTNLTVTQEAQLNVVTWDYPTNSFVNGFRVKLKKGTQTIYDEVISAQRYEFTNLTIGTYDVFVKAVGSHATSTAATTQFTVSLPSAPTNLLVTDSYIEWQHANLSAIQKFIVTTTSGTDIVAHDVPKNANTIQRLEITGIKTGTYDVSIVAVTPSGLESIPATLTNAQIDGLTTSVTPIVDNAVSGFADDPHTWTDLNNFTGGLQKDGVDVKSLTENNALYLGISAKSADSDLLDGLNSSDYMQIETSQTIKGQKNFTGGLLKNNTDVISLGDLSVNSAATQALASVSMEQFETNRIAGLYDDYTSAEGSIAVGYLNGLFAQFNYFASQGANIEKIKSSAIEVSGAGYALNQNPTWQGTVQPWTSGANLSATITASVNPVRAANQMLYITTASNDQFLFSEKVPVSKFQTYAVSLWLNQDSTATQALAIEFFDSSDNRITSATSDAVGWPNIGTYHYWGLVFQSSPTNAWSKYELKMGNNADVSIPSGAAYCKIGARLNYTGDVSTAVYLQDYRIEKATGSTSIENGSIKTEHLVLSGNGAITFDTVGADQAGSAATAETNAKDHADTNDKVAGSVGSWALTSGYIYSGTTPQTSNAYDTGGMTLDANGAIRSKEFRVDTDGSAHFKGDITGASGTFSGSVVGATIKTSSTGQRVELSGTEQRFYSGTGTNHVIMDGSDVSDDGSTYNGITIDSNSGTNVGIKLKGATNNDSFITSSNDSLSVRKQTGASSYSYLKLKDSGSIFSSGGSAVTLLKNPTVSASFTSSGDVTVESTAVGDVNVKSEGKSVNVTGHIANTVNLSLKDNSEVTKEGVVVESSSSIVRARLLYDGQTKLVTTSSGVHVTGSVTEISDPTIKNFTRELDGAESLNIIENIELYEYTYKDPTMYGNGIEVGVDAVQAGSLLPSALSETEESLKTFNYKTAYIHGLSAIKQLKKELDAMRTEIQSIKDLL